jgi:hypothetical protein
VLYKLMQSPKALQIIWWGLVDRWLLPRQNPCGGAGKIKKSVVF